MTEYVLKIKTNENNYSHLTTILNLEPTRNDGYWEYSINEDNELYTESIDFFLNLIELNLLKLKHCGITSDDITIWFYKPYEGQCNMEFSPQEMKKMADNGITLCISCWEI